MTFGVEPSAEALAKALDGKRAGAAWKARCPVHDDAVASLAIGTKNGRTVFRCHAGCKQNDVLEALIKAGHWPKANGSTHAQPVIVATYDYRDEQGELLFQAVRYLPKDFRQRRPDGAGGWVWNMRDVRIIPYRLPELLEAIAADRPVMVVEGEKDVDSLAKLGIVATCNAAGAGKWRLEHTPHFRGADVVVCPDNDDPGRAHTDAVAKSLTGIAKRVRRLLLPDLPDKGDVSDWIGAGGSADALWRLIEEAPDWKEGDTKPSLRRIDLRDLMAMDIAPREMILSPIIPEKGLVMLYASRGIGKTHAALGISVAISTGGRFLRWKAPKPRRVLHIDGEMPAGALQERLMWTMNGTRPAPGMLQFLIGDLEDLGIGNLASPEVQQSIEPYLDGVSLVTLDNLSSLTAAIRDNDAESWGPIQDWLLRLRRRGIAVLIVHHAGKGGDQRGTSRREDVLDTSIALLRPSDYEPQQGARFEVHLRKARGILGDEVAPFEARLVVNGADATWTMEDLTNVEHERVARLLGDGLSIRDIATETGMSKSAVHRLKSKIDEQKTRDAFRSGLGRIEPYDFNELS